MCLWAVRLTVIYRAFSRFIFIGLRMNFPVVQYSKLKPGIHYTISPPIFLSGEVNESQSQSADLIDSTENHVVVYDGQFSCHCLQSWKVYDD